MALPCSSRLFVHGRDRRDCIALRRSSSPPQEGVPPLARSSTCSRSARTPRRRGCTCHDGGGQDPIAPSNVHDAVPFSPKSYALAIAGPGGAERPVMACRRRCGPLQDSAACSSGHPFAAAWILASVASLNGALFCRKRREMIGLGSPENHSRPDRPGYCSTEIAGSSLVAEVRGEVSWEDSPAARRHGDVVMPRFI